MKGAGGRVGEEAGLWDHCYCSSEVEIKRFAAEPDEEPSTGRQAV